MEAKSGLLRNMAFITQAACGSLDSKMTASSKERVIGNHNERRLLANRVEHSAIESDKAENPQKPQIDGEAEGNQSAAQWNAPGFWQTHQKQRCRQTQKANLAQRTQADHHRKVLKPTVKNG